MRKKYKREGENWNQIIVVDIDSRSIQWTNVQHSHEWYLYCQFNLCTEKLRFFKHTEAIAKLSISSLNGNPKATKSQLTLSSWAKLSSKKKKKKCLNVLKSILRIFFGIQMTKEIRFFELWIATRSYYIRFAARVTNKY